LNKPVIIVGAGGHAKVVFDVLKLSNIEVLGFLTPDLRFGKYYCGKKILGDDSVLQQYLPNEIEIVNGVGALPGLNKRWELSDKMSKLGYHFATIIHPTAIVSSDIHLNEGVQIMAGAIIQSGVTVGKNCIINTGAVIDHDCKIEDNCHIAPGVICSGEVIVRKNTHIGTGVNIIQAVTINENCIVAAGSTVYKNIPSNTIFKQKHKLVTNKIVK